MSDDKLPASAGWYPDPNGGQRFWDESSWLDLPDPDSPSVRPSDSKRNARPKSWRTRPNAVPAPPP